MLSVMLMAAFTWPLMAEETTKTESPEKGESGQAVSKLAPDVFKVPDGSPEELMKYAKNLEQQVTREIERLRKGLKEASSEAADKILAGNPGYEEGAFAVQLKMKAMKPQERAAFVKELKEAGKDKLARIVLSMDWQQKLRTAMMMRTKPDKKKELIDKAMDYLNEAPPEESDAMLARMVGWMAESLRDQDYTVETYQSLMDILKKSDNPKVVTVAKKLAGVVRRLTLVGNKVELEGVLLDGEKLDMSKYKGKVVLVDFWATWCGPCVGEVPNMKKNYKLYHDKGFEILGFSLDRSREPLEKFVEARKIPWSIVYGPGNQRSPSVEYYGVSSIPTMFLIGKDGKVVSTKARGKELDRLLEELLGSPEEEE
ncbi:MAG: TlpA family protein disulfide reductase [Pirellulales bacterium]|nr:TlpA family protein disulfide reductase [Pirellulales bacterium]